MSKSLADMDGGRRKTTRMEVDETVGHAYGIDSGRGLRAQTPGPYHSQGTSLSLALSRIERGTF